MKTLSRPECRTELAARLRAIGPESPAQWGRMSAPQMICHLTDAFRMALGGKPVSSASGPLERTVVKWLALYLPLQWRPGLRTRPEIDQHHAGTSPGQFADDVAELLVQLETMVSTGVDFAWPPHPIFGRMTRAQWMRWGYLHTDHHLRQFGA